MIDRPKALAVLLNLKTHDGFLAVLDALEQTVVIDLNDPATENLVADAIRRLAPEDAYVPLHVRYPWRFSEATAGGTSASLVDVVVAALRGSAEVHEAERLPHLVPALLALAEALERGALVPGPPPGPCPVWSPEIRPSDRDPYRVSCELRATHAGLHEATQLERYGLSGQMRWPDGFAPANGQEQAEAWERVIAHPALQPAHDVEGPLLDAVLTQLDRFEKLDDLEHDVREEQAAETARAVLEYLQPVIPDQWAHDAAGRFGVKDLYVADPAENVPPRDLFRPRPESDGIGR